MTGIKMYVACSHILLSLSSSPLIVSLTHNFSNPAEGDGDVT